MKYLYVWEGTDVLQDYTSGMICAVADDLDQAWAAIQEKDGTATYQHEGEERVWNFRKCPTEIIDLSTTGPVAFTCWGGG